MLVRLAHVDQLELAAVEQLGDLLGRVVGVHALEASEPGTGGDAASLQSSIKRVVTAILQFG